MPHSQKERGGEKRGQRAALKKNGECSLEGPPNGKNIYESRDRGQLMETKSLNTLLADSSHTPS